MRRAYLTLPALLLASAASAQAPQAPALPGPLPQQAAPPRAEPPLPHAMPGEPAPVIVPPELTDPRIADQIGRVAGVLTRSMMDLPVGELEAAIEGRPVTRSDRRRRVSDTVGDPYLDQRIADQIGRVAGVLTRSMMDLPVGELEAAIEGRPATEADRRKRVRDEIGPDGERQLTEQVARAGPQMRAMQKALATSLPSIMASLEGVERELERAVANMPDPTYPRR